MGRYYGSKKKTVERCRSISVSFLNEHGFLCGYQSGRMTWVRDEEEIASIGIAVSTMDNGGDYIKFDYAITDSYSEEQTSYDYKG